MKACSKCGVVKGLGEFNKSSRIKDGHKSECRECQKIAGKLYKENNIEKEKIRGKKYRAENKEKESARQKLYKLNNIEKEKARSKKYREDNKQKCYAASEKCRKNNPEKYKKHSLDAYYRHHEKKKELAREYKKDNKEKIKAYMQQWRSENKHLIKKYYEENIAWFKTWESARRAKKIQANVSWANNKKIKSIYDEAIRLTKITGIQFHVDHIIPLNSKYICGFHHEDNLQILTWIENTTKSNKFTPT